MNEFLTKIAGFFEGIIHPWHLLFLMSVFSGGLLLNPFGLVENLSVSNQTENYRFWILLVFGISAGLLFIKCASESIVWVRKWMKRVRSLFGVSKIELSPQAQVILLLISDHRPDHVQLLTQHYVVRELRLHELIKTNPYVISFSEYASYGLSERGEIALGNCDRSKFQELTQHDQLEFLRAVTGLACQLSPKSWML